MIPPGLDPTKLPNGSISSFFRGHKIRWDKYAAWWYFDESNKMIPTIAEYDARIGLQCQKGTFSVEDIFVILKNISCLTLVERGKQSPFLSREEADRMRQALPKW